MSRSSGSLSASPLACHGVVSNYPRSELSAEAIGVPNEVSVERRLSAILAADVVEYSRLVGVDEAGTLARLSQLRREIPNPLIAESGCSG